MNGPDIDPDYWQTYGVIIAGETLYNLRVKLWPWFVSIDGTVYSPPAIRTALADSDRT